MVFVISGSTVFSVARVALMAALAAFSLSSSFAVNREKAFMELRFLDVFRRFQALRRLACSVDSAAVLSTDSVCERPCLTSISTSLARRPRRMCASPSPGAWASASASPSA
jgi:hypothetical protein